jgi:uncharacterized protein YjdB
MVAQISSAGGSRGQATALSPGQTRIVATFMGVAGASVLTVSSATIKEIELAPTDVSTPAGVSMRFEATAILSDGSSLEVTSVATWTSSDGSVVAVSSAAGSRGLATALAPGVAVIQATAAGVSGRTSYTVGAQTLVSITVDPAMLSLSVGDTQSLTALGNYSDGSAFDLTDFVTWISTSSGVAAVSNAGSSRGVVTGVSVGGATIEAHFQSRTGMSAVTVTP